MDGQPPPPPPLDAAQQQHQTRLQLLSEAVKRIRDVSRNFDLDGVEGIDALRQRLALARAQGLQLSQGLALSLSLQAVRRALSRGQPFDAEMQPLAAAEALQGSDALRALSDASRGGVASPAQLIGGVFRARGFGEIAEQDAAGVSLLDRGDVCSFYQHVRAQADAGEQYSPQWLDLASQSCRVYQALDDLESAVQLTYPSLTFE